MTNSPPAEEPDGYRCERGYVKSRPENNDFYVDLWKNDPWYWPIKRAHKEISLIAPGYNISQLKEKFFELRFYYRLPDGLSTEAQAQVRRWVSWAEAVCQGIDAGRKMERGEFNADDMYYPEPGGF